MNLHCFRLDYISTQKMHSTSGVNRGVANGGNFEPFQELIGYEAGKNENAPVGREKM